MKKILKKEKNLYKYGKDKIEKKIYYPGFFIVGGQKNELWKTWKWRFFKRI